MIRITAFGRVPPFARGQVRDLRVRWALEEAGLPYAVELVDRETRASAVYRAWQPFGQVPAFAEEGLELFESGAIVLHLGERSEALLPREPAPRARAVTWLFAALNSVEPPLMSIARNTLFEKDEAIRAARASELRAAAECRLAPVAERMAAREWLEDRFTCGDLMMASVLRIANDTDLVTGNPPLAAYLARCEARPAFVKALADHLADLEPAED